MLFLLLPVDVIVPLMDQGTVQPDTGLAPLTAGPHHPLEHGLVRWIFPKIVLMALFSLVMFSILPRTGASVFKLLLHPPDELVESVLLHCIKDVRRPESTNSLIFFKSDDGILLRKTSIC